MLHDIVNYCITNHDYRHHKKQQNPLDKVFAKTRKTGGRNRADALCSAGSEGADQAGNLGPAASRGARHPATAQRQGTDRPLSFPQRHQPEPQHRSGKERVALQGRLRRRRRRHPVGDACRRRELQSRRGDAEARLLSFRARHGTAAAKIHDGETAAADRAYGQRQAIAGSRGRALSRDAEGTRPRRSSIS